MTSYETERALVHFAEQIIKTFGKEIGIQDLIQERMLAIENEIREIRKR